MKPTRKTEAPKKRKKRVEYVVLFGGERVRNEPTPIKVNGKLHRLRPRDYGYEEFRDAFNIPVGHDLYHVWYGCGGVRQELKIAPGVIPVGKYQDEDWVQEWISKPAKKRANRPPSRPPTHRVVPVAHEDDELTLEFSSAVGTMGKSDAPVDELNELLDRFARRYLGAIEATGRWKMEVDLKLQPNNIRVKVLKRKAPKKRGRKKT